MADFLDAKRKEIADRMAELRPLVDEAKRLERADAALAKIVLGSQNGASGPTPIARRGPGRPRRASPPTPSQPRARVNAASTTKKTAGRRKGQGKRQLEVLAAVQSTPGITIAQLSEKLGVQQTSVHRILRAATEENKVVKVEKGWHPKNARA